MLVNHSFAFLWISMLSSFILPCFQPCGLPFGLLLLDLSYHCCFPSILSCPPQILTLPTSYTFSQGHLIHTCNFNHRLCATTALPVALPASVMASILSYVLLMMILVARTENPTQVDFNRKGHILRRSHQNQTGRWAASELVESTAESIQLPVILLFCHSH